MNSCPQCHCCCKVSFNVKMQILPLPKLLLREKTLTEGCISSAYNISRECIKMPEKMYKYVWTWAICEQECELPRAIACDSWGGPTQCHLWARMWTPSWNHMWQLIQAHSAICEQACELPRGTACYSWCRSTAPSVSRNVNSWCRSTAPAVSRNVNYPPTAPSVSKNVNYCPQRQLWAIMWTTSWNRLLQLVQAQGSKASSFSGGGSSTGCNGSVNHQSTKNMVNVNVKMRMRGK